MTKRCDSFAMGDRDKLLDQIEREPILVHVAVAENQRIPFEAILRSVLKHLVDAATNEFLFIVDFFRTNPKETFNRIYAKTIAMLLENLENYLLACYDAVGILLMIRVRPNALDSLNVLLHGCVCCADELTVDDVPAAAGNAAP